MNLVMLAKQPEHRQSTPSAARAICHRLECALSGQLRNLAAFLSHASAALKFLTLPLGPQTSTGEIETHSIRFIESSAG